MDALAALLTVSGLLLAGLAGIVALTGGNSRGVPNPPFKPKTAAHWVVGAQFLLAGAAVAAWWQIYGGGSVRPPSQAVQGGGLLVGITVQPLLALYLALGMRTK